MHELSIAVSLIEAAEERAAAEGAERIARMFLRIGPLSGVVPEALMSAFELAAHATMAEGAVLEIERVPISVFCAECEREVVVGSAYSLACPDCGRPTSDVRSGSELEFTSMEIEN